MDLEFFLIIPKTFDDVEVMLAVIFMLCQLTVFRY